MNQLRNLTLVLLFTLLPLLPATAASVDAHFHFLSPGDASNQRWATYSSIFRGKVFSDSTLALKELKAAKVDKAVAISAGYFFIEEADAVKENDFTAQEIAKHPESFVGLCGINAGQAWALKEIERCKRLGFFGVKFHLTSAKVSLADKAQYAAFSKLVAKATELKMPVFLHVSYWVPQEVEAGISLSFEHPTGKFVYMHAFGPWYGHIFSLTASYLEDPKLVKNAYVDLSFTATYFNDAPASRKEDLVWTLRKFGIDRVFMGSDFPVSDVRAAFTDVRKYPLTKAELRGVEGANFEAFLRASGAKWGPQM